MLTMLRMHRAAVDGTERGSRWPCRAAPQCRSVSSADSENE